jgi:hypothetical protein
MRGLEHLVGAGADAEVVREIDPADCSGGVDEKLRRARNVMATDASTFVQEIVAADCVGLGIREECISVASLAAELLRRRGRIDAPSL